MNETFQSLDKQIAEIEVNLHLIEERKAEYPEAERIPLELIKNERQFKAHLIELRQRRANLIDVPCPYRGLEIFDEAQADFFFGRDGMVKRLVEKIEQNDFVTVVGASGSGKSSLVRAGLISALRHGALQGSENWRIDVLKPGLEPLDSLCATLVSFLEPDRDALKQIDLARTLATKLLNGEWSLNKDILPRLRRMYPTVPQYLLVIDQFEEVFTSSLDSPSGQKFLGELATTDQSGWLKVLITLRADYFNALLKQRALGERVDSGLVTVLPMSEEEHRAAIERPAFKTGRSFEPGLVDRILDDIAQAPGDLPLLQFALTQLWERQTAAGVLTHAAYESIGEVSGAIAEHASTVFGGLEENQQQQIERLFKRLVRIHTESDQTETLLANATNWRIHLRDLDETTQKLVNDVLVKQRLVVTGHDETTGEETVELSHEALIQHWPDLRMWVTADPASLRIHQSLIEAINIWEHYRHDGALLYTGTRLNEALAWQRQHGNELNQKEQTFLALSVRKRYRQFGVLGLVAVVILGLAAYSLIPRPSGPTPMPANQFNVAVNTFAYEPLDDRDSSVRSALERDAESFAQEIADRLSDNQASLSQLTPLPIGLSGPQALAADLTDETTLAEWMKEFNINLLISGDLRQTNERYWTVTPKFYTTESALQTLAGEALESTTLGQSILFVPGNLASQQATMAKLNERVDVLLELISGLSYYDLATNDGLERAASIFCGTATQMGSALNEHGRDLLFLFCGHSLVERAWAEHTDAVQYTQLLGQGIDAYRKGLIIDPANLRLQVSLGAALLQQATPDDGCNGGDFATLQEARHLMEDAASKVSADDTLRTGTQLGLRNVLGRIHFGLGCLDQARRADEWAAAAEDFEEVIARHDLIGLNNLQFNRDAANAHRYIGVMRIDTYFFDGQGLTDLPLERNLDVAAEHLDLAIRLLIAVQTPESLDFTVETLKWWLTAACLSPQADPKEISQYVDWFVGELAAFGINREDIIASLHPQQKEVCGL